MRRLQKIRTLIAPILTVVLLTQGAMVGQAGGFGWFKADSESYRPGNFRQETAFFPSNMRRVLLLPLTSLGDDEVFEHGRTVLQDVLTLAVGRTELFEVVTIEPAELRQLTGRGTWSTTDELPGDFFEKVREELGCDGVLFTRLTAYRPYTPMSIGWNVKLVATHDDRQTVWSADAVFNAGNREVAEAARKYHSKQIGRSRKEVTSDMILHSPRQFGEFTLTSTLATIQGR